MDASTRYSEAAFLLCISQHLHYKDNAGAFAPALDGLGNLNDCQFILTLGRR